MQGVTRNYGGSCRAPLPCWHKHFASQKYLHAELWAGWPLRASVVLALVSLWGVDGHLSCSTLAWKLLQRGSIQGLRSDKAQRNTEHVHRWQNRGWVTIFRAKGWLCLAQGNTQQSWELLLLHLTADNTYQTRSKHVNAVQVTPTNGVSLNPLFTTQHLNEVACWWHKNQQPRAPQT